MNELEIDTMRCSFGWDGYEPVRGQYDLQDHLFTETGMRDAHARLQEHYANAGQADAYTGQFYPGAHKFDLEMQSAAFDWLKKQVVKTRKS